MAVADSANHGRAVVVTISCTNGDRCIIGSNGRRASFLRIDRMKVPEYISDVFRVDTFSELEGGEKQKVYVFQDYQGRLWGVRRSDQHLVTVLGGH